MQRIVISEELEQKLDHYPHDLQLCNETGISFARIERVPNSRPTPQAPDPNLSEQDLLQTLRNIFLNS